MTKNNNCHVLFHVPHDGQEFPTELMRSVCIPKEEFMRYHEIMRDTDCLQMVPVEYRTPEHLVSAPVSRLLCDVERFIGPEEVMERYGMGYCYERAYDGRQIKTVSDELKQLTYRYYREHHQSLDEICMTHRRILLIDLHSFSDTIVPAEFFRAGEETPDVCIGTDPRYTPPWLTERVFEAFRGAGYSVKENYPYSGCLVPNAVMKRRAACECAAVMVEINKRAYCDIRGKAAEKEIEKIRGVIGKMIRL